jgi:pyruvate dehydrogenase E1 component
MVPFTFYSMFGFQRVGDLLWSAGDSRARGFLLGATAGRTTLLGEGLQHQDGHSLVLASTNPAVEVYDPAFAYELGAVIDDGLRRMYGNRAGESEDVFYYLAIYNENYVMPPRPDHVEHADIVSGIYQWNTGREDLPHRATVLFSGSAHGAARAAQDELASRWGVAVDLYSVTSYKRHASMRSRSSAGTACIRAPSRVPHVTRCCRVRPDRSSPSPTSRSSYPIRSHGGSPRPSSRSAPTASVAVTPARRCGASSRSTWRTS